MVHLRKCLGDFIGILLRFLCIVIFMYVPKTGLYISANNILNKRESERIIEINTGKSGTRSGFYCDFYVPKTGLHISSNNISKEKERDCGFYGDRVVVFNATFNNISTISWRSVYWWRKPEYTEKTTDLPQVTDKLTLCCI